MSVQPYFGFKNQFENYFDFRFAKSYLRGVLIHEKKLRNGFDLQSISIK
jgi:hypothetical protein